ncbi:MAG: alpha-mannosidase, partial [Lentisphaeria bacterium]|nr:alpha-mannosidase [Lentisphaeria bacterium]
LIHIRGFVPFTLWIDGEEAFCEERNWHATGPIAAPLRHRITPGEQMHLVLSQTPTAIPAEVVLPAKCVLQPRACLDRGVEIGAAAAQLQMADAVAETREEKELLSQAAAAVDQKALEANQWPRLVASLARMESILAPLSPKAKQKTVHLIGHTHIDLAWLWTWEDTLLCTRRDFKATADLLEDVPDLTFANSQVASFEIVQERDPEVFERMKQLMDSGRWENVAALWDDTDLNMVNGESLARQVLYAADWSREHLGHVSKVLWAVDIFGHPGNMPQIARLAEAEGYRTANQHPDLQKNTPFRQWKGIDGTVIPTLFSRYGGTLEPAEVMRRVMISHDCGLSVAPLVWGIVDHGGGMSRLQLEILSQYRDKPLIPTIVFSTPSRVLEELAAEGGEVPVTEGETHSQFAGCFTTHADVKRYNRACEGALLTAETLAALGGLDRRKALAQAWRDTFFNQFHDVLCGCSAPQVYEEDVPTRGERCLALAQKVTDEAVETMKPSETNTDRLTLFNPLGFSRTEPVRLPLDDTIQSIVDADGQRQPVQQLDDAKIFLLDRLPAFACKTLAVSSEPAAKTEAGSVDVVDADAYFRIETDCGISFLEKCSGVITSQYDKALGQELIHYAGDRASSDVPTLSSKGMNLFQIVDCAPTGWSAWHISDTLREESLVRGATVELADNGPVFARFKVQHHFRASHISEDVIFYKSSPRIDFEVTIDWREPGGPDTGVPHLKLAFGSRMSAARTRSEGPFTIAQRPADGTEQPMQTWVDLTGDEFGFAVLNDCKYGYEALGSRLRLSLLRTGYAPDPISDSGVHTMRFAFLPHRADLPVAQLVKAGMSYNRAPIALPHACGTGTEKPFLRIDGGESVVCTTLRQAEHSEH